MAGGSKTKENPRDQQCSVCGRWFHWRGVSEHEKDCNGEEAEADLADGDVWDPRPDYERVHDLSATTDAERDPDPDGERVEADHDDRDDRGAREGEPTDQSTSDTNPKMTESTDESDENRQCPHCGSERNITTTDEAVELYRRAGKLTDEIEAQLRRYQFYHNDHRCKGMWSA